MLTYSWTVLRKIYWVIIIKKRDYDISFIGTDNKNSLDQFIPSRGFHVETTWNPRGMFEGMNLQIPTSI